MEDEEECGIYGRMTGAGGRWGSLLMRFTAALSSFVHSGILFHKKR
jgi:hypothetical protein